MKVSEKYSLDPSLVRRAEKDELQRSSTMGLIMPCGFPGLRLCNSSGSLQSLWLQYKPVGTETPLLAHSPITSISPQH